MTTVLFWDIDGTLLTTKRAGIFALEEATTEVVGTSVDLSDIKTAGMIDPIIVTEVLQRYDVVPEPAKIERLLELYGKYLPASLSRRQGYVLQGVREILEQLQSRTDVVSLLLTGNIEAGAKAKLSYYGLDSYFRGGAFSDGAKDRSSIARKAIAIAEQFLGSVSPDKAYVIGDTPHDISCGKAIGARAIAVASGSYTVQELEIHQPWLTLPYLPKPGVFFQKIGLEYI